MNPSNQIFAQYFSNRLFETLGQRVLDTFPIKIISDSFKIVITGLLINVPVLSDLIQLLDFLAFLRDSGVDIVHHLHL